MNMIQPLTLGNITGSGIFSSVKPIIIPLLSHNLPRISGLLLAGFAGTFLVDRLVNYSFKLSALKLKISRIGIFLLSGITGIYCASKFTLLHIPEKAYKIQAVVDGLKFFEIMLLIATAGVIVAAKKNNSYVTKNGAVAVLISHLFASSIYPSTNTLVSVSLFSNYIGLCLSYAQDHT